MLRISGIPYIPNVLTLPTYTPQSQLINTALKGGEGNLLFFDGRDLGLGIIQHCQFSDSLPWSVVFSFAFTITMALSLMIAPILDPEVKVPTNPYRVA